MCGDCAAAVEAYRFLSNSISSARGQVKNCQEKASSTGMFMSDLILSKKPIDEGKFKEISIEIMKVYDLLGAMIGECNEFISKYSNCTHLLEEEEKKK